MPLYSAPKERLLHNGVLWTAAFANTNLESRITNPRRNNDFHDIDGSDGPVLDIPVTVRAGFCARVWACRLGRRSATPSVGIDI